MYSYRPPHMAEQKQDDQLEHTYSSYVWIWDLALKTCQKRWTIGRSGERCSGISVLAARPDDDDDIYICVCVSQFLRTRVADLISYDKIAYTENVSLYVVCVCVCVCMCVCGDTHVRNFPLVGQRVLQVPCNQVLSITSSSGRQHKPTDEGSS